MFIGSVRLAVDYQVFMDWVNNGEEVDNTETAQPETVDQVGSGDT